MSNAFAHTLAFGQIGESAIARWFQRQGYHVLPAYQIAHQEYKGPVLHTARHGTLVTPDMLVFGPEMLWVEAKHKHAFTWHRLTGAFCTGIDLRLYAHYLTLQRLIAIPVWLFFYHGPGRAKDSPPGPAGLYGQHLGFLAAREHHRHENWGRGGMVYWAEDAFVKFAPYPLDDSPDADGDYPMEDAS